MQSLTAGRQVPSRLSLVTIAMASLIAILDLKGKPLIQRSYRDDVPPSYIERFLPLILEFEEEGQQVTPCFSSQGINYMHIRHSNLYRALTFNENTFTCSLILPSPGALEAQHQRRRSYYLPPSPHSSSRRILQGARRREYT